MNNTITSKDLAQIVFRGALQRVHDKYGIYNQFEVHGNNINTFMLLPRTDRGYDAYDMANLSADIEFLTEQVIAETEL